MSMSSFADEVIAELKKGDYATCLDCWDKYVVKNPISTGTPQAVEASVRIEFTFNLICATFPFRVTTLRDSTSISKVARDAARSMMIFKKFMQTRGQYLISTEREFMNYRILHKVAFPPTHPMFRHLFTEDWLRNALTMVRDFLLSLEDGDERVSSQSEHIQESNFENSQITANSIHSSEFSD